MVFLAIGPAANGNVCFWHIADIDADDEQCPLIGTPRFGLVEQVNAFVNQSETKTLASLDRGTNVTQVVALWPVEWLATAPKMILASIRAVMPV